MSRGAVLALKITGDAKDGVRALGDMDDAGGRFEKGMGKVAAGAAVALGGLAVLGKGAFDAASAAEQSLGAIDSVFGDWALDIEQFAEKAVDSVGLSKNAYQELAAVMGSQLKNAGMPIGDVTAKTDELIRKGADLAATFGGTTAEAVEALSSVLKGETDPIERYGVSVKQSDINARLAAQGQDKLTGSALKTATANAALALVTEQTTSAVGAFAREGDTAAGKGQRLSAWWENAQATLGEKLLPVFVFFADFLTTKVAPIVDRLIGQNGPLTAGFAAVGDFVTGQLVPALSSLWEEIGPKLVPIFETVSTIITGTLIPAFQGVWGFVQDYVVPILGTVLGPILDGIGSVFKIVSDKINENKDKFSALYTAIEPVLNFLRDTVAPFLSGVFAVAFDVVGTAIGAIVDALGWVVDKVTWLLDKGAQVGDFFSGLFGGGGGETSARSLGGGGGGRGAAMFGAGAPLLGASMISRSGGAGPSTGSGLDLGGTTVNNTFIINGALDPIAVGRQVRTLAENTERALGGRPAMVAGLGR